MYVLSIYNLEIEINNIMPAHKHVFEKYINNFFVETGTFKGEGIDIALNSGFNLIDSIEFFEEFFLKSKKRFEHVNNVNLYYGKSEEKLWDVIKNKNEKITFWLDAHYMGPVQDEYQQTKLTTGSPLADTKTPILRELEIISHHHIKEHIIMIDDMRCCGTELFDFISKKQIEDAVLKINPNYNIHYENSWVLNDILIAKL